VEQLFSNCLHFKVLKCEVVNIQSNQFATAMFQTFMVIPPYELLQCTYLHVYLCTFFFGLLISKEHSTTFLAVSAM
jgi:hypothetical protein